MASDLKADQRMSDDEVLAQITTFVRAGLSDVACSLGRCSQAMRPLRRLSHGSCTALRLTQRSRRNSVLKSRR